MTCTPSYGFIDQLARVLHQYHKGRSSNAIKALMDPPKMTCTPSYGLIDQLTRTLQRYHRGYWFLSQASLLQLYRAVQTKSVFVLFYLF